MSPAPRMRAERPASSLKILPATATAADGAEALGEDRPHGLRNRFPRLGEIEFGAVAGGEQHAASRARREHALERRRHVPGRVPKALPHLERRRPVVHPENRDAHGPAGAQRNRSVPGAVSFSARYTSRTAVKLAMLANAARRPAQCRTTRTPTAHPSTIHVSVPQTTWAESTEAPPA